MAFIREIGRNGVLIEPNRYIGKSIAINQIEKRDINDMPTTNCALRARYGVSNRIESNRIIYQLIESIKFHINDITRFETVSQGKWSFKRSGR